MALGADGVQIGSRFVASEESSAHINFKNAVLNCKEGDTKLTLKELTPVRLIKNDFYHKIEGAYHDNASPEKLQELLGRGRAKKGMFNGDLENGELEIGQISGMLDRIMPAGEIVSEIINEFNDTQKHINEFKL